jgi:hypothetical protein
MLSDERNDAGSNPAEADRAKEREMLKRQSYVRYTRRPD